MNGRAASTKLEFGNGALLAIAIASIASSALLVRWSDAPPLAMAFWRTAAGAVVLSPAAIRSATQSKVPTGTIRPHHYPLILLAGGALGLHFASWLPSLTMTSVAASVTLVSTAPVFVALALLALGRPPGSRTWLAIGLAVLGSVVIASGDLARSPGSLDGDLLALLGAVGAAIYLLTGDHLRQTLATPSYAAPAYAIAAGVILPVCLLTDTPLTGFDTKSWLAVAGMILGPQMGGHTILNHLLGQLGSVTVSLALLTEPVLASALVWLVYAEAPPLAAWIGAPIVIGGMAMQVLSTGGPIDPAG